MVSNDRRASKPTVHEAIPEILQARKVCVGDLLDVAVTLSLTSLRLPPTDMDDLRKSPVDDRCVDVANGNRQRKIFSQRLNKTEEAKDESTHENLDYPLMMRLGLMTSTVMVRLYLSNLRFELRNHTRQW